MADAHGAEAPIAEVAPGLHQLVSGVELPAELFHYTGAEGVLGILESGVLRATRIDYLNDSAEYQAGLALARTAIAEIRDEDPQ